METLGDGRDRIRTALLLAAGTGNRLQPLTDDSPKWLTEVNETTILERLIRGLRGWEFERLVVVVTSELSWTMFVTRLRTRSS